jgi:hypothetical protein
MPEKPDIYDIVLYAAFIFGLLAVLFLSVLLAWELL